MKFYRQMEKNNLKISDFRYERKFFITRLSKFEVESIVKLHPSVFTEIFHKRFVNNIYFDTYNFKNLYDNVEGVFDRIKIRIRWYGDLFGYIERPVLEIKIKKGLLGKKISIPIPSFYLNENTNLKEMLKSIEHIQELVMIDFKSLIPTLLNRYSRKYYKSSNKKYRVTIDTDQSFHHIKQENNFFISNYEDKDSVILELKYDQSYDKEIHHVSSNFPFRVTKSSKYVTGLQKILQSSL